MATVIESDLNRYEVVKVLNPDGQVLNVAIASGSPSTNPPAVSNDAFGRLRVSNPFTLFDSSHRYGDNDKWNIDTVGTSTSTFNPSEGLIDLTVGTNAGDQIIRETKRVFAYQPGKSLLIMSTFVFATGQTGLRQRVGYFDNKNGIYVQFNGGTTLSFVKRSFVTGAAVDTVVNQADWNVDKLDGTGPSGITIDITKAQIVWTDMEWLGVGNVRLGFMYNGQFVHCHTFEHANIAPTAYLTTACLPVRYEITNTSGTANTSTLKQICSTVLSEGGYKLIGRSNSVNNVLTSPISLTASGTFYPLLSIRLLSNRLDAIVVPTGVSFFGKSNTVDYNWQLVEGGTTTGGTWAPVPGSSVVEYNRTPTGFSGGHVVNSGFLSGSVQGNAPLDLDDDIFKHQLERNTFNGVATEFTLVAAASSNSANILGSINWDEIAY